MVTEEQVGSRVRNRFFSLAALLLAAACREQKPLGQLVISIQTDMAMPDQIDTVRVQVLIHDKTWHDQDYPVGNSTDNPIPATLTLLAGNDPSAAATVRVMSGKGGRIWRTYVEKISTVPADRTALMRMPLQWLCDGTAATTTYRDANNVEIVTVQSTCGAGNTCRAGTCVPSEVPESTLPTYSPQLIFGGAEVPSKGTCFDTVACMLPGVIVEPREQDCTLPKPADERSFNVALRVPADGICDDSGTTCFVPLEANSPEGWMIDASGDRVALPPPVCQRLKGGSISAVYVSTACATKTEAIPPCGAWSSVHGSVITPVKVDAAAPATAQKVASLNVDADGLPCCPLMGQGATLYTCMCSSTASARLVSIDLATHKVSGIMDLATPADRGNLYFAAAISDGTLFWVDAVANTIQRASVSGDAGVMSPFLVNGEITEATPLLVDATSMYVLASAVSGATGSPVQLLSIDRASGAIRAFDTTSNFHVHQFAQDSSFVYVASDSDIDADAGTSLRRSSRIVRIAKTDGALSGASAAMVISTPDKLHGGYIGVQTNTGLLAGLYALYEEAPSATGTVLTRIVKVDPTTALTTTLVDSNLDPSAARLWLLGVVDGAVLFARTENGTADGGTAFIRSASVMVLPAGGGAPRIVAEFAHDNPIVGLQATAYDTQSVYWLNSSGDLFRLSRAALE